MSLFKQFATDAKLEAEGVQITYNGDDGQPLFRVRLARAGGANHRYEKARDRIMEPYRRAKNLSAMTKERLSQEIFAEAVALPGTWEIKERVGLRCGANTYLATNEGGYAWAPEVPKGRTEDGYVPGIEMMDGSVAIDTPANVAKVFAALPELFVALATEATTMEIFRQESREDDSKNS